MWKCEVNVYGKCLQVLSNTVSQNWTVKMDYVFGFKRNTYKKKRVTELKWSKTKSRVNQSHSVHNHVYTLECTCHGVHTPVYMLKCTSSGVHDVYMLKCTCSSVHAPVYILWYTHSMYTLWCTSSCVHTPVYMSWCTSSNVHTPVYMLECTCFGVHVPVYMLRCTHLGVHPPVYTLWCTFLSVFALLCTHSGALTKFGGSAIHALAIRAITTILKNLET